LPAPEETAPVAHAFPEEIVFAAEALRRGDAGARHQQRRRAGEEFLSDRVVHNLTSRCSPSTGRTVGAPTVRCRTK